MSAVSSLICITIVVLVADTAAAVDSMPNFLVLFVDDMGMNQIDLQRNDVYSYTGDNGTIATPNVKQLADEGMTFQTWYSSFHVCSPSRGSMMTGRYSVRFGIGVDNKKYSPNAPGPSSGDNLVLTAEAIGGLPLNETTIAERLKAKGYRTGMAGKWHLGVREMYMPVARGFDKYLGIPFSQDMGLSFWAQRDYKPKAPFYPTPIPLVNNFTIIEQPVDLSMLVVKYCTFINDFINEDDEKPFYIYASWNHVHGPNSCSAPFCNSSVRGAIGDAVQEVDHAVGSVMNALRASKHGNNTLVFFTSDNGAPLGGDKEGNLPLRGGKTMVWEGGFREPGIVWFPGKIKAGSVSSEVASTMDIFPTILAFADAAMADKGVTMSEQERKLIEAQAPLDGIDLSPILLGTSGAKGHACYFFYAIAVASDAEHGLAAVRCGDYKAYWLTNGVNPPAPYKPGVQTVPILFDLKTDVGENFPIPANSSQYKTLMAPLIAAREAHLATITPCPSQNGRGNSNEYAFCSDPNSKSKYPNVPNCTMNPENWEPKTICNTPACHKRYPCKKPGML